MTDRVNQLVPQDNLDLFRLTFMSAGLSISVQFATDLCQSRFSKLKFPAKLAKSARLYLEIPHIKYTISALLKFSTYWHSPCQLLEDTELH